MPKQSKQKSTRTTEPLTPRRPRNTIIPGTHIKENELVQARRFLGHQRSLLDTSSRFTIEAIRELERVFHKNPSIRADNLADNLSDAGKQLLSAFENELHIARGSGITNDWWYEGNNRKGVSVANQQAYAAARRALSAGGMGIAAMMGVLELGMEDVEAEDLADTTEADLEGDGANPTAEGTPRDDDEDEDLSRFDEDEDVRGYEAVLNKGVPSMAMASEHGNMVLENA